MNSFFSLSSSLFYQHSHRNRRRSFYIYRYKYSYALVCSVAIMEVVKATETFFSLQDFAHRSLWRKGEPVWSPLLWINEYLNQKNPCRIEIDLPEGVILKRKELISIGKGTVIDPGVLIVGPCIIGSHCVIRQGAYIREGVICGDFCHIGHSTELKQSILLDHAAATHFVYVGDSILGNYVSL